MKLISNGFSDSISGFQIWNRFNNMEVIRVIVVSVVSLFFPNLLNIILCCCGDKFNIFQSLSKSTEIISSIVSGLFIVLFFKNLFEAVFDLEFLLSIASPILFLGTVLLLVSLVYMCFSKCCNKRNKAYEVVSFSIGRYSLKKMPLSRFSNNKVGCCNFMRRKTGFNNSYSDMIYLTFTFFHGFNTGLGFNVKKYFSWYNMIIYLYKLIEFCRLKQATKKLNYKKITTFIFIFIFSLATPIGMVLRGLFTNFGLSRNIQIFSLCDSFFIESSFVMALA
ncbi:Carbohydrate kinase, FGGY [Nosema bombycis CQ1]|uniref:Carbohydrate kinase, FGGY n=1 Tax=Nosema bombycis (strain CQ1 / CVCC 102059) TaxID=578461 RepID=R0M3P4_NOSB1|nr:Carbohydrate kinase, FGGY [Nosema bombycis CQ1]|eukprot:EOB12644.1 Carbohydrate kinase, FGGY [Nosema bombycis CQ1]